jgi:two-component system phosphate regulon response regulator PhoB
MSALILVADADPFDLRLLSELCGTLGYEVMTAADGGAVLDAMARQRPSLVLMDAGLPVMDGLNVLGILKADSGLRDVPVLLVTQENDTQSQEQGRALGADDCLVKPYRPLEIQQRLREIVSQSEQDERSRGGERRAPRPGEPLAQVGTVNQLHISLEYEFTRAVRYKHALSCIVIYVEGTQSEAAIDAIANTIKGGIRTVDHLFRSAESEFSILLPETNHEGARIVVERLRALLREHAALGGNARLRIAVSAASYPAQSVADGEALYASARNTLPKT